MTRDPPTQDRDDLADRLHAAGPLPRGLPPGARARLEALAASGPWTVRGGGRWQALGLGLAAGIVLSLGILTVRSPRGDPTIAWTRAIPDGTWTLVATGSRLPEDARAWREVRLADGSTIDVAPGCRLALGNRCGRSLRSRDRCRRDPQPSTAVRLETGAAYFSVVPGAGTFAVEVPGGRVEVMGTAFEIAVRGDAQEGGMVTQRDWIVGSVTAIVTVTVTSGLVSYLDKHTGETLPIAAGERLEVDRDGARRLQQFAQRDRALTERERAVEARERRLRETEQAAADRAAAAENQGEAGEPSETPVSATAPTEEERVQAEVLAALQQLLAAMQPLMAMEDAPDGTLTPEQEQQMLAGSADLMAAYSRITLHRERIHGELGATVVVTLLDGILPPDAKLTEAQRGQLRRVYADSERRLESLGVPKHRLLPIPGLSGPDEGLDPWQIQGRNDIYRDALTSMSVFLTPRQNEELSDLDEALITK